MSIKNESFSLQSKVFTRWVNDKLKNVEKCKINNITQDLSDGKILIQLAHVLTKSLTVDSKNNNIKESKDMNQNFQDAIDLFNKDGVKLSEISEKDLNDKYQTIILKFIWELISHYSVRQTFSSQNKGNNAKENSKENESKENDKKNENKEIKNENENESLISWAKNRIAIYPYITNFHPYELALCALLDSFLPDKIHYYSLDPKNSEFNLRLAIQVMKYIGITIYIYPEDVKNDNEIDEKSLIIQLSSLKKAFDVHQSMSQTLSFTVSDETNSNDSTDDKSIENTANSSSGTFVEIEDDSFSSLESHEKISSCVSPSFMTLSNSDNTCQLLAQSLTETQRVAQKQIEKLMERIDKLTQQLYESKGKEGELILKDKINQKTINNLQQKLSDTQNAFQEKIDNLNTEIIQLKTKLEESEKQLNEQSNKLSEIQNNDQSIINNLKQQLLESESKSKELSENNENLNSEIINLKENLNKLKEINQQENGQILNSTDEIAKLQQKLSESKDYEITLLNKLKKTEENYDILSKQLSETNLNMRKAIFDSEMKLNQAKTENDEIKSENKRLQEEIAMTKINEVNLSEQLEKTKKKSEDDINKLMEALSDSENKCISFYDEKQMEIETLKKELLKSQEIAKLAQIERDKFEENFNSSQANVAHLYRKLYSSQLFYPKQ